MTPPIAAEVKPLFFFAAVTGALHRILATIPQSRQKHIHSFRGWSGRRTGAGRLNAKAVILGMVSPHSRLHRDAASSPIFSPPL